MTTGDPSVSMARQTSIVRAVCTFRTLYRVPTISFNRTEGVGYVRQLDQLIVADPQGVGVSRKTWRPVESR